MHNKTDFGGTDKKNQPLLAISGLISGKYKPRIFGTILFIILAASAYVIIAFFTHANDTANPLSNTQYSIFMQNSNAVNIANAEPPKQESLPEADEALANLAPPTLPKATVTASRPALPVGGMVWNGTVYVMKSQDNKICIYNKDMNVLYNTLDIYVSTLPLEDQRLLAAGIEITTEEQLNQLIEAYSE